MLVLVLVLAVVVVVVVVVFVCQSKKTSPHSSEDLGCPVCYSTTGSLASLTMSVSPSDWKEGSL